AGNRAVAVRQLMLSLFFFQAEDGIRDFHVTGVQTCALPIFPSAPPHERCSRMTQFVDEAPKRLSWQKNPVAGYSQVVCHSKRLRSEERRVGKECRYRWWQERQENSTGSRATYRGEAKQITDA